MKVIPCIVTRYHNVVCLSVCMSFVTLVHPAKSIGCREMPFGRDTRVISNNIETASPVPHEKGRFGGQNPQFAVMPPVTKLLWLLLVVEL